MIDTHDYMKRVMSEEEQPQQQQQQNQKQQSMVDPLSSIYAPPFTYTKTLRGEPTTEGDRSFYHQQLERRGEADPSLSQPPLEGGSSRDSHGVLTPKDEPPSALQPPGDPPGLLQVAEQWTPRQFPKTERAPSKVQSPEASSNALRLENDIITPIPRAPAFNIVTPIVPPIPPPIKPIIVGDANTPPRRHTALYTPKELIMPGDEFLPVTHVGLSRTPRTPEFQVVLSGMGEDSMERLESTTSIASDAILPPPNPNVSEEARGVQRWQAFNVPVPLRGEAIEVKVQSNPGSMGSVEGPMVEGRRAIYDEGRLESPGGEDFNTNTVAHDEESEYDEDDDGEFEMVTVTDLTKSGPTSDLVSVPDGNVQVGTMHPAKEDPPPLKPTLPPPSSRLLSRRSSASSSSGQKVEGDDWYPRLPTDGVVDLLPKNQGKSKSNPIPVSAPEVIDMNQGHDAALQKSLGGLVKESLPSVRPSIPPAPGFYSSVLDGMSGKQSERIQLEGRWEQKQKPATAEPQDHKVEEPQVPEPVQVSLPMKITTRPSSFRPLAIGLDTVSLGDMLGESTEFAVPKPSRVQLDNASLLSQKSAKKEPSRSAPRPAPGDSDLFDFEEALSRERVPAKLHVEPVVPSGRGQGEFGRRDLGRTVATVQGARKEFESPSPAQLYSSTLPTHAKSVFAPPTPISPDTPPHHPTRSILPPLKIPTKSVFELPTPVPTDSPKRSTSPPLNKSILSPSSSMPMDMLSTFPSVPTHSPPRPASMTLRNPNPPRAPPAPKSRPASPPHELAYQDLLSEIDAAFRGPLASASFNSTFPNPATAPPPHLMPQQQVSYHPRSSSLPEHQIRPSSPQSRPSRIVTPSSTGYARSSPPNGSGVDIGMEPTRNSYSENFSSKNSPLSPASGKEKKKKPSFASVMSSLLKGKKEHKKTKRPVHGLGSIEEDEEPRYTGELGYAEQDSKQSVPIIGKSILPPNQPIKQVYISPSQLPQKLPPSVPQLALTNVPSQSSPMQGSVGTTRVVQSSDEDEWVSKEQRTSPIATGAFAADNVRNQPMQGGMNATYRFPPHMRTSQETVSPHDSLSHLSMVTTLPPLIYHPSIPIKSHVAYITTRLEAERGVAISGGAPIPSRNTASIPHVVASLSHLNTRIGEACAVLTKAIVFPRISTGESTVSLGVADTQHISAEVGREMRTRLCEFLTGSIFGRFSIALGSEEDRALREAHGDLFMRCRCSFYISP
jgi:hypothetical protein